MLITAAVPGELAGLADRLTETGQTACGQRRLRNGRIHGIPVRLLVTGPGMANTVQALTAAVEQERPGLMLQTGCAGAFAASGLRVGDIAVATGETDLELGIESETELLPAPLPFPVLEKGDLVVRNRYPVDPGWSDWSAARLRDAWSGKAIRVGSGPFVTVSTITATDRRADAIYARYRPCMEAMEGAGAAFVAAWYGIPFLEIRSASNRAGNRNLALWNFDIAFEHGAAAVLVLLHALAADLRKGTTA